MKKITGKKLQLNRIVIARLSTPKQHMFWGEPGQSTLPNCDPLRPPTVATIDPGVIMTKTF